MPYVFFQFLQLFISHVCISIEVYVADYEVSVFKFDDYDLYVLCILQTEVVFLSPDPHQVAFGVCGEAFS